MSLQSSSAVTSSDNNLVLGHFNCPFLEWNNSKKRLFILWQEGSSTLKFWGWIQRPSGSRKSARSWSRFGVLFLKNFQCKSCIRAKSLNGVLARGFSGHKFNCPPFLFFFKLFKLLLNTAQRYILTLHDIAWYYISLHYNELQIHYITLHCEPDYELWR